MSIARYLYHYLRGLLLAIVTDTILTSLFIGSVALGGYAGVLVGIATFFLLYTIIRTVNTIANAIGNSGKGLITALSAVHAHHGAPGA